MEIRTASSHDEIVGAIALDEVQIDSKDRAGYIMSVAESGGLSVAVSEMGVLAFCCLDHRYFLGKPFISLLIVSPGARRQGLGTALLSLHVSALSEVWTSTNRSNLEMRALLQKADFRYCGELDGLDQGDPEQFFKYG
ncbi:GNAT family N-acetyltransferase [Denitrobaculum tricleocarpae]|uniref:GNAT family N-acetyltransferase n=1 Tax=Denitrobaculum tricleocarpae TaxID=2591009 RepID=A0A545TL30_9PROT|nr:GNAT family N-acetyltransferase [Denitrobaculum tricleocarpae]TQV77871.1 GNAT family N-acetyltransferase [Denitrobaculum tricleocarpae]